MTTEATATENEAWFLAQLEAERIDVAALTGWLTSARARGDEEQAESSAELLQDTLAEQGRRDEAIKILQLRASWLSDDAFRTRAAAEFGKVLGNGPEVRAMVDNAGFESGVPVAECFRRVHLLRALLPGVLCCDRTWGAGIVRNVDWFYKRIDIDFEKKQGHQMSFGYAGEALEILSEDHLLAVKMREPQRLAAMVAESPEEVVRMALRSFGDMPIARLQDLLVPEIVAADQWKGFWDGARKALKKDPLIDIPARRTEPIRLLDKQKAYDSEWFAALGADRDMGRILERAEDFLANADVAQTGPEALAVLVDRLAFVRKGASGNDEGWVARAVMAAAELPVRLEAMDPDAFLDGYLIADPFLQAVTMVPARDVKRLLAHLRRRNKDRLVEMLIALLPRLGMTALNDAMDLLFAEGQEERCAAVVRDLTVETEKADVEVLYWLMRHPEKLAEWKLGRIADLAFWVMRGLDVAHNGDRLKTQNQLRDRFEQKEWLETVLDVMDPGERGDLVRWVKESQAWSSMERRSVLAIMVKRYPELGEVVSADAAANKGETSKGPLTSLRSYHERQAQLEKIVTFEIPTVAKEIGVARSYGDLRENFEFKAAKDKQALLLRRRAELEQMLNTVRPTDFAGAPGEQAGQGVGVDIEYPDGRRERFFILGVWDRDEALGIISSDSKMAQALTGHRAGDDVVVPGEHGDQACRVAGIVPLSEDIQTWVSGNP